MKRPLIHRSAGWSGQHGVTMVLVALAMVAIIAMAALSIDVITLYLAREEAQRAADTGALAAARVISLSGITGDPSTTASWQAICGGSTSPASQAAAAVALQNVVGGAAANNVLVSYGGSSDTDCSKLVPSSPAFTANPTVTVQVQRTNLPNFFSRIWGKSGTNVSASATAEAFNSSSSDNVVGSIVPVQPSCVKPWFVPNYDPRHPDGCTTADCNKFVDQSEGFIINPGISLNGTKSPGVIGESFWLGANCTHTGTGCNFRANPIKANLTGNGYVAGPPNLLYYPGQAPTTAPLAVPSCSSAGNLYEQAIAGCDQSTHYQCGVAGQVNTVDMSENPSILGGDTPLGVQCLIHQGGTTGGQDTLVDSAFPFQILAGSSNPMVVGAGMTVGTQISASNSVVSLPIYDPSNTVNAGTTSGVTVVGFLQVFINQIDDNDNMFVTVLNVTGCSNGAGDPVGSPVLGTSPVPIRLITPP